MYIAPDSTIELFRNLKLDNNYSNTMWFSNASRQDEFFTNHYYLRYNSYSYQRKDNGVIRIGAPISSLYAVDYMRFKNTLFENKWFYAFVNRIEYVNNDMCNIYYTIDVIQTYMFNWVLEPCLIERQHSVTDVAGDNLVAEGLELGDYINSSAHSLYVPDVSQDNYSYLICAGLNDTQYNHIVNEGWVDESAYFQLVAYQYAAVAYLKCNQGGSGDPVAILNYLNEAHQIEALISITLIPKAFTLDSATHYTTVGVSKPTKVDGHTPVNKKLLTYPYTYLDVYNDQNEHEELRFELFTSQYSTCNFKLYDIVSPTPEAILMPQDYNNITMSPETGLAINGYPQIPYFNDSFKAWVALNYDQMAVTRQITAQQVNFAKQGLEISQKQLFTNTAVSEAQGALNIAGNLMSLKPSGVMGAASTAVGMAGTALNYGYETQKNELAGNKSEYDYYSLLLRQSADESRARNLPNTSHAGSGSTALSVGVKGFWYNIKSVRKQYAERIDKYFTMFGYAQNIVGIPNIHARQYFTYIKTVGSCVSGYIPQDDRETIDTIFDRGIRFWTDYTKFEDYSVNNAILT